MTPQMVWDMAAAEESGPDIGKILGQFAQYGVVGLIVVLLTVGVIVPKYVMNALTAEKDNWRTAFEQERAREQLIAAQARVDTANEQGRAMVQLLEKLGHRTQPTGSARCGRSPAGAHRRLPSRRPRPGPPRSPSRGPARAPEAEGRLTESRRVKERLGARNRANAYSDWIEGIVLGRLNRDA
ncbi:hypothetical protein ACWD0Z_16350 [Streptomyces sp. NPDC003007]